MLKIQCVEGADQSAVLKLAGGVIGPWVDELSWACDDVALKGRSLALDLAEVSFLDRAGIALLRQLVARRVQLLNCSPFLTEQLKVDVS